MKENNSGHDFVALGSLLSFPISRNTPNSGTYGGGSTFWILQASLKNDLTGVPISGNPTIVGV